MHRTLINSLRVMVGVKRVVDYTVKVRVKDNCIQTVNSKMSINPFDEIAIQQAIRLKEKKITDEVLAVTIGPKKAQEVLRTALALGCDKAVHVIVPQQHAQSMNSLITAQILAQLWTQFNPDICILGKQAVDGDYGCTAQLLAGLVNASQGTFASTIDVNDSVVRVTRDVDHGHQIVDLNIPCVLAADLRLNTPRFPKLPNIMKARKKPIDTRDFSTFNIPLESHLDIEAVRQPASRQAGVVVKSIDQFYSKLRNIFKASRNQDDFNNNLQQNFT